MERETVVYRGKKYHRYPESKRRQLRVYFWRHDTWKAAPFALHRQIWIDNFGTIPPKHHIHHKDGNPLNNETYNLECISAFTHLSEHGKSSGRQEHLQELARIGRESAKAWHGSDEGRAWHREHAKLVAHGDSRVLVCAECSASYTTTVRRASIYCGKRCKARHDARIFRQKNPDYYNKKSV